MGVVVLLPQGSALWFYLDASYNKKGLRFVVRSLQTTNRGWSISD
jgi:hypothetical protein